MRSVISGNSSPGSTSAANYSFIHLTGDPTGLGMWNATESLRRSIVPHALTLSKLYMRVNVAPGSGKSWTYTIYKNGSPTALTVTISDTALTGVDNGNSVSFAAGDRISLEQVPSGTPASSGMVTWTIQQEATDLQACLFGRADNLSNSANRFSLPTYTTWDAAANGAPMPTAGVFKNLYIALGAAPGAGKSYTFELYKNGVATGVQVVIADAATSGSDTGNTASFSAGDTVYIQCTPAGTPTATTATGAISFDPTVDGQSIWLSRLNAPSNSATGYNGPLGPGMGGWSATESTRNLLIEDCTVKNLYIALTSAPGAGTSIAFNLRKNSGSAGLSVTIADTNTSGDNAADVPYAQSDTISLESVPTSTPTTSVLVTGIMLFIGDFNQPASDTATPSEAISKAPSLNKSDTATLTESVSKQPNLIKAETATSTDAAAKTIGVIKAESVGTAFDVAAKTVGKFTADGVTGTDANAKTVGKNTTDSVTLSDLAALSVTISRTGDIVITLGDVARRTVGKFVSDSLSLADAVAKTLGVNPADSITESDLIAKTVQKLIADSVTLSDSANTGGAQNYTQSVSDFVSVQDSIVILFNGAPLKWYKRNGTVFEAANPQEWYSRNNTDWSNPL